MPGLLDFLKAIPSSAGDILGGFGEMGQQAIQDPTQIPNMIAGLGPGMVEDVLQRYGALLPGGAPAGETWQSFQERPTDYFLDALGAGAAGYGAAKGVGALADSPMGARAGQVMGNETGSIGLRDPQVPYDPVNNPAIPDPETHYFDTPQGQQYGTFEGMAQQGLGPDQRQVSPMPPEMMNAALDQLAQLEGQAPPMSGGEIPRPTGPDPSFGMRQSLASEIGKDRALTRAQQPFSEPGMSYSGPEPSATVVREAPPGTMVQVRDPDSKQIVQIPAPSVSDAMAIPGFEKAVADMKAGGTVDPVMGTGGGEMTTGAPPIQAVFEYMLNRTSSSSTPDTAGMQARGALEPQGAMTDWGPTGPEMGGSIPGNPNAGMRSRLEAQAFDDYQGAYPTQGGNVTGFDTGAGAEPRIPLTTGDPNTPYRGGTMQQEALRLERERLTGMPETRQSKTNPGFANRNWPGSDPHNPRNDFGTEVGATSSRMEGESKFRAAKTKAEQYVDSVGPDEAENLLASLRQRLETMDMRSPEANDTRTRIYTLQEAVNRHYGVDEAARSGQGVELSTGQGTEAGYQRRFGEDLPSFVSPELRKLTSTRPTVEAYGASAQPGYMAPTRTENMYGTEAPQQEVGLSAPLEALGSSRGRRGGGGGTLEERMEAQGLEVDDLLRMDDEELSALLGETEISPEQQRLSQEDMDRMLDDELGRDARIIDPDNPVTTKFIGGRPEHPGIGRRLDPDAPHVPQDTRGGVQVMGAGGVSQRGQAGTVGRGVNPSRMANAAEQKPIPEGSVYSTKPAANAGLSFDEAYKRAYEEVQAEGNNSLPSSKDIARHTKMPRGEIQAQIRAEGARLRQELGHQAGRREKLDKPAVRRSEQSPAAEPAATPSGTTDVQAQVAQMIEDGDLAGAATLLLQEANKTPAAPAAAVAEAPAPPKAEPEAPKPEPEAPKAEAESQPMGERGRYGAMLPEIPRGQAVTVDLPQTFVDEVYAVRKRMAEDQGGDLPDAEDIASEMGLDRKYIRAAMRQSKRRGKKEKDTNRRGSK